MRNPMLVGLFLVGTSAVAGGCAGANPGEPAASTGSSRVRIVVSTAVSGATAMHLIATCDALAGLAVDKTIPVSEGPLVIDLEVPPSTCTVTAAVLSGDIDLGLGSAQADLQAGETTQITVAGQSGQAAGGSAGSATVQISVDVAPRISGVDVEMSSGADAGATTKVHVHASKRDGGSLTYFWSGADLLQGAVQGSSTLSLPTTTIAAAASRGAPVVHVVVVDARGAAAAADIALVLIGANVQGSMSADAGASARHEACFDAQAVCNAACPPGVDLGGLPASANASCFANCAVPLLSCDQADPPSPS